MDIRTASIREPGDDHMIGDEERAEKAKTFYVLGEGEFVRTLKSHLILKLRHPIRYLKTFGLALKTYRPGLKGFLKQIAYFAEAGIIALHANKIGATHIHNHFGDQSANVAMLAAQLANIPFSFTIHGPTELEDPYGWAMDKKIELSKFTVCISEYSRNFASNLNNGRYDDKLFIIHCGVFPENYTSDPQEPRDGLRLIFVGRLNPVKGVPVLFDALDIVSQTRDDVSLRIVGGGSLKEELELRAQSLSGVEFLGYLSQQDVAKEIERADALVLPSFAEGLPVVYMEALASARPAIATDVAGVSELIVDDETGLLIEPGDPKALAEAILKMAADPDARSQMGLAGRAAVAEGFNIREEAKRMKTLYLAGTAENKRPSKSN